MKKISIYVCIAAASLVQAYAQKSTKEVKGDKFYSYYFFDEAIEKYSQADNLTTEGYRRLAESYKNTGNAIKAEETYAKLISLPDVAADDYFNYASILKNNGKYNDADKWMAKFTSNRPNDLRSKAYINNRDRISELMNDEGRYKIDHLSVNTDQEDFGTAFFNDKIVFASSRGGSTMVKRSHNWNDKPFLDLYVADVLHGQLQKPKTLTKKLNKKLHEGPATFSTDGKHMAFTRNNYKGKSKDGVVKLQIFFSELKNGDWTREEPFKLNSAEYSVGHPHLTSDGNTMYFASDMPGGLGGTDLYRIKKNGTTWGEPENLGDKINTEGNEMFPFFEEGTGALFFASNGHLGLGGLDLFLSPLSVDHKFEKVVNMGAPLNTQYDDFALIIDQKIKKGYFSSNRTGGKGGDDIYSFELLKPFVFGKTIKGIAKDKSGAAVPRAVIELKDENGKEVASVIADENGAFSFIVDPDKNFKLNGSKEKYFDGEKNVNTSGKIDVINADVVLEKDPGLSLYCLVTEKENKKPLEGVMIKLKNNMTGEEETIITAANGDFRKPLNGVKLNDRVSYTITLSKDGYLSKTIAYNKEVDKEGQHNIHQEMDLTMEKISVGADLASLIDIKPIYFDLAKYNIRKDATVELDKIVKVMNENPNMVIELGSHTDCRSSSVSNEKLSDKRAKASAEYIKKKISNPERIYGKGYGESKLKNGCACEGTVKSTCTETEHQENRRTEFIIIKM